MPIQTVTEIESLPHAVRDLDSRRLIDDAIAAYYSGALRSSIVSTWTAVVTDIISKIREIEPSSDAETTEFLSELKCAINLNHKEDKAAPMMAIEKDILVTARDRFQFIDYHEHDILDRIRKDRHKCAHPAFTTENQLFYPSPDLVRSHIVHALEILLTRPPVQGISDIGRFSEDIFSISFPSNEHDVKKYISSKYIDRRKDPFIEKLMDIILEVPFSEDEDELSRKLKILAWTLRAIHESREDLFTRKVQSFISQKEHTPPGTSLLKICPFLGVDHNIWSWMKIQIQLSLIEIIEKCTIDDVEEHRVLDALNIRDIEACLTKKMNEMDVDSKEKLISRYKHTFFVPFAIDMFKNSESEDSRYNIGMKVLFPLSKHFDTDGVILMHKVIKENLELSESYSMALILEHVFDETRELLPYTKNSWQNIVEICNPDVYENVVKKLKATGL